VIPLIVVFITLVAALVAASRFRVPGGVSATDLGWMSEQWLAEYRMSNRTKS
jgi:hypothetical protein